MDESILASLPCFVFNDSIVVGRVDKGFLAEVTLFTVNDEGDMAPLPMTVHEGVYTASIPTNNDHAHNALVVRMLGKPRPGVFFKVGRVHTVPGVDLQARAINVWHPAGATIDVRDVHPHADSRWKLVCLGKNAEISTDDFAGMIATTPTAMSVDVTVAVGVERSSLRDNDVHKRHKPNKPLFRGGGGVGVTVGKGENKPLATQQCDIVTMDQYTLRIHVESKPPLYGATVVGPGANEVGQTVPEIE